MHFAYRIDMWTADGESIVDHIAGVEDYQVAMAISDGRAGRSRCGRAQG
jgi:hypothetical protein